MSVHKNLRDKVIAEIERAKKENTFGRMVIAPDEIQGMFEEYQELEQKLAKAKAALEFYALRKNYEEYYIANLLDPLKRTTTKIEFDVGSLARQTLAEIEK